MQDLTKEERARYLIYARKLPELQEIEECLESADKTLRGILRTTSPNT